MSDGDGRRASIAIKIDVPALPVGKTSIAVDTAREHHLIEVVERERRDRRDHHHERRGIRDSLTALCARPRDAQEHDAERHVDDRSFDEQRLQPHQRKQHEAGQHDPDDRAERVRRVDDADRALAVAAAYQHSRDERERHARAESRREHHGETGDVAGEGKEIVARVSRLQRADERRGPSESGQVKRDRCKRGESHRALYDAQRAHWIREAVSARAHPPRPEGEPEDERREHQLERVRRAAEEERQHPNPRDFVDERGDGGSERDDQQEPRKPVRDHFGARRSLGDEVRPRLSHWCDVRRCGARPYTRSAERDDEYQKVDRGRSNERERQPSSGQQPESRQQYPDGAAEAVGEIELGKDASRVARHDPQHARAHEREGGAQQNRLRQNQERGNGPLERDDRARRAGE